MPATAVLPHQVVGPDLRRQPAGNLAHRRQQRQGSAAQLYCLVSDAGDFPLQQCPGAVPAGCQMKVGEQHLTGLHAVVLDRNRLFDLQDQLRVLPDVIPAGNDLGSGIGELVVGDR